MKKGFFLRLFVLLMLTFFIAEQGRAQTYQRTSQGIKSTVQGINIDISFFSPVTVRILKSPDGWKYTKESLSVIGQPENIIRKTKCFDFWERNVLFPKTKRSFFRTPKHPLPCPFPLNFSLLIITKKFGNLAKNRYICIV